MIRKMVICLLITATTISICPSIQAFAASQDGKEVIDTNKKNIVSRQVITVNGKDRLEILTSGKDKSQYVLNGEILKNQWYEFDQQFLNIDKDGKKTLVNEHYKIYLDENGYKLTGWQVIDGEKYYMGAKGVKTIKGESGKYEKYLFNDDGKLITDQPVKLKYSDKAYTVSDDEKSVTMKVDGVEYNVPKDESLAKDRIVEKDGKYYYANPDMNYSGVYHIEKSSEWRDYYAKEDGTLAKNEWVYVKKPLVLNVSINKYVDISAWKYYGQDMKNVKGYQTINGKKYYFSSNGSLKMGWKTGGSLGLEKPSTQDLVKNNFNWYYLGEDGVIKEGWIKSNGNSYYIYSDGLMAKDTTTPDGYHVNKKGICIS